jgi:hypothetical protein
MASGSTVRTARAAVDDALGAVGIGALSGTRRRAEREARRE